MGKNEEDKERGGYDENYGEGGGEGGEKKKKDEENNEKSWFSKFLEIIQKICGKAEKLICENA